MKLRLKTWDGSGRGGHYQGMDKGEMKCTHGREQQDRRSAVNCSKDGGYSSYHMIPHLCKSMGHSNVRIRWR